MIADPRGLWQRGGGGWKEGEERLGETSASAEINEQREGGAPTEIDSSGHRHPFLAWTRAMSLTLRHAT